MQGCYIDAADRPPAPVRISLETLTAERVELYSHALPPGQSITIEVDLFPVYDNIPGGGGIFKEILRLQLRRSGDPSGMRVKHLRMWLCVATQEEEPDPGNWEKVFNIIQVDFKGG